ncbi:MAG: hypothetical protein ACR2OZ_04715 [Verrucomicrobiales bacterium]
MRNPFTDDIFSGEFRPEAQVASVHADTLEKLSRTMPTAGDEALGRAIVLAAPRAGFGKTHLVTRFAAELLGRAAVVPLTFDLEKEPRWQTVLWDILEKLHRDHGHRAGLTMLDEAARFLFARVNQRLIEDKRVPCAHPAEAIAALDRNYVEMFDFSNPSQPVAKWFGEHFERLSAMSSESLAPAAQVEPPAAVFWLRILMSYAQAAGEPPEKRLESLRWAVNTSSAPSVVPGGGMAIMQEAGNSELSAKERLRDFARILSLYRPLVFVIDHLDVFFRDGKAGLRIAYFVSELRRLVPRSLNVVCVNQDLWEATFRSQLPSALEDRLAGGFLHLKGLDFEQGSELIRSRSAQAGLDSGQTQTFVDLARLGDLYALNAGRLISPRAVLRYAAERWEAFLHPDTELSPMPAALPPSPPTSRAEEPPNFESPSDASVVGNETLDSIAEAIQAMAAPPAATPFATEEPNTSSAAESRSTFQQLKERLQSMRQPRPEARPGSAEAPPAARVNGTEAADAASLAFAENFRRQSLAPLSPGLDWERLGELLRFGGEHSPAVRFSELVVAGAPGTALQWLSPDAEILFGLEPATRPTFWSALTAYAGNRARQNGGLSVKVVVFAEKIAIPHPAAEAWQPGGAPFALDLVETSPSDLAAICAATDLITQVNAGAVPASEAEVAATLARELDAFWRRLTRMPSPVVK